MKKIFFLAFTFMVVASSTSFAQTSNTNTFEGEVTTDMTSVQKIKSAVKTKNLLAKVILKAVMKKVENTNLFNGSYETTTVTKGNLTKTYTPYNDSYTIVEKNGDQMKTTTYFPSIKKGYYTTVSMSENQKQLEEMRKGTVEKTGETMEILGHKCEVYQVKYEVKTDSAGMTSTTNLNNSFAICSDPSLPGADQEYVPGIKGVPLKFINNTASQTTSDMLNLDVLMYIASTTKAIKARAVDDSEFAIPDGIKLIDGDKDQKGLAKMIADNQKYLKKKGIWNEKAPEEIKIYDNLTEEWDY